MDSSKMTGWRVFCAHLTDLSILFYIAGIVVGFFELPLSANVILTFIIALPVSFLSSAVLFSVRGTTLTEWLWGCKLQIDDPSENKFLSYLGARCCLNDFEFIDYKNSIIKNFIGLLVMLAIAVLYMYTKEICKCI